MRFVTRRGAEGLRLSLRIARALSRYASSVPRGVNRSRFKLPLSSGKRVRGGGPIWPQSRQPGQTTHAALRNSRIPLTMVRFAIHGASLRQLEFP